MRLFKAAGESVHQKQVFSFSTWIFTKSLNCVLGSKTWLCVFPVSSLQENLNAANSIKIYNGTCHQNNLGGVAKYANPFANKSNLPEPQQQKGWEQWESSSCPTDDIKLWYKRKFCCLLFNITICYQVYSSMYFLQKKFQWIIKNYRCSEITNRIDNIRRYNIIFLSCFIEKKWMNYV